MTIAKDQKGVYGNYWFKTNHFIYFDPDKNSVGIYFEKQDENIYVNPFTLTVEESQLVGIARCELVCYDFMRNKQGHESRVEKDEFRFISEERFQKILKRRRFYRNRAAIRGLLRA